MKLHQQTKVVQCREAYLTFREMLAAIPGVKVIAGNVEEQDRECVAVHSRDVEVTFYVVCQVKE